MATRFAIPYGRIINSSEVGLAFKVGKLPYAVLISELGIIVAQGLMNTREHLESLMVAYETGLRSVQDYLTARKARQQASGNPDQATHKHL